MHFPATHLTSTPPRAVVRIEGIRAIPQLTAAMLFIAGPAVARDASLPVCGLFAPPYQLASDTVIWVLATGGVRSCVRGLRVKNSLTIDKTRLISLPESGHVTLEGPGFMYKPDLNFKGMDFFEIAVSGKRKRVSGNSTVQVVVSVP
jgi:hypothetical protein